MAERVPSVPDLRRSVHGGHGVLHGQHVGLPQRGRHVLRGAGPQPREPAHVAAGHARAGTLQPDLGPLRTLLCRGRLYKLTYIQNNILWIISTTFIVKKKAAR